MEENQNPMPEEGAPESTETEAPAEAPAEGGDAPAEVPAEGETTEGGDKPEGGSW